MALDFYLRSAPDPDPDDGRLYDGSAPAAGLQAVRFDAGADVLTMPSAALPSGSGGWTLAGWFRIVNDRNAVTTLWSLDGLFSSSWHSLRTTADGTSLRLNESGTDVLTIASLAVGTWYFLAVRKDASGNVKAYVGTEAGGALSTVTGTVTNIATYSGDGYVAGNAYGDWFDGRAWGLRLWDVELSDAEVDAEFSSSTEARTANRRARWPIDNATTPGTDASGNGRNLTNSGGSWALEAGPTLPTGGGISVGTTGVVTGVNAVSTAAGIAVGATGVLTGVQTPSTAAGVSIGAVGVLTGLNAPSLSTSGNVSPSPVGVLTGVQTPSLAAGVAPGAVGALTGVQTASLAASVAVGPVGVLTGVNATTTSTVVLPAAVGVLTGVQSVTVEPPLPDVWAMVGASRTRAVVTSAGASRVSTSSGSSGAVSVNGSSSATTGDAGGSTATTT